MKHATDTWSAARSLFPKALSSKYEYGGRREPVKRLQELSANTS